MKTKNNANNNEFELSTQNIDTSVNKEDFVLVNTDDYKFDSKFETRPTTFLKDSIKRFSKNKSSVVAAWILGVLIGLSFIIPIVDTNNVSVAQPDRIYLEPKLFDSGFGFWDGCKSYSGIAYDQENNCPDQEDFSIYAVQNLKVDSEASIVDSYSKFGVGGYVRIGAYYDDYLNDSVTLASYPYSIPFDTSVSNDIKVTMHYEEVETYQFVKYSINFNYVEEVGDQLVNKTTPLVTDSNNYGEYTLNVSTILNTANPGKTSYEKAYFTIVLDTSNKDFNNCILIKKMEYSTDSLDNDYLNQISAPFFTDANEMIGRKVRDDSSLDNKAFWSCTGNKHIYHASLLCCSFTYDTYAAAFGTKIMIIDDSEMNKYRKKGWCTFESKAKLVEDPSSFVIKSNKCPIQEVISGYQSSGETVVYQYKCKVTYYKYIGLSSMPRYLMGTESSGYDMLKYVFEGLRTSLLLGIITSAICFLFGLLWGSISGYFGGLTDLLMERFTDILGGLPWIVIMTLCIVHLGQNFFVFALALCLTGWIGTSATTRTQFYRFKGREYVLASRTLGAKDTRLIFKHILPNALGTIITGAVLMIPGVIFSEATISYLGLGLKGLSSLGVILSDNQSQILDHSYLLLFPSAVIALLMISFNLFGNGLRDAINPSLKGEGE